MNYTRCKNLMGKLSTCAKQIFCFAHQMADVSTQSMVSAEAKASSSNVPGQQSVAHLFSFGAKAFERYIIYIDSYINFIAAHIPMKFYFKVKDFCFQNLQLVTFFSLTYLICYLLVSRVVCPRSYFLFLWQKQPTVVYSLPFKSLWDVTFIFLFISFPNSKFRESGRTVVGLYPAFLLLPSINKIINLFIKHDLILLHYLAYVTICSVHCQHLGTE